MAKFMLNPNYFLFTFIHYLVFCFQARATQYDSSFTLECLEEPLGALYQGGLVVNAELNEGSNGWSPFGDVKIEHRVSSLGNKFIVASNRKQSFHSFTQTFHVENHTYYTFSVWLRLNYQNADVAAILKMETKNVTIGRATARKGCWSMLKGGLVPDTSGPAQLYFQTNNTKADLWGDSFSLQQFTHHEWTSHQDHSIEKVRKTNVELQILDEAGRPVPNALVSLEQKLRHFPFGCAINANVLKNERYQKWFVSKFKNTYTVFENELKWPSIEDSPGVEDYSVPDAMVRFTEANNIKSRGHCVLWNRKDAQPKWTAGFPPEKLSAAATRRINSVVRKYKGKFIHWDVDNENIHNNFFEVALNDSAVASKFYNRARAIDPIATPFLNEFNTIETPGDPNISPQKYLSKIREMRKQGYNWTLGIGVQGHFTKPDVAYVRASLDILAKSGLQVWVTELDVAPGKKQAYYLRQILQEIYSHSAVAGIIVWSAWNPNGCYQMCLTDNNFTNLATGNVVDSFMKQLTHDDDLELRGRTADSNGVFRASVSHGVYQVHVSSPNGQLSSAIRDIDVRPNGDASRVYRVTIEDKY